MHVSLWFLFLLSTACGLGNAASKSNHFDYFEDIFTQSSWELNDCGTPRDFFRLSSLTVYPDPPTPGKSHALTLSGSLSTEVKDGVYACLTIRRGNTTLIKKRFDICEELKSRGTNEKCPMKPGDITINENFDLPEKITPGKYSIKVQAYTSDDQELACADIRVDFSSNELRGNF